jgi:thymidylate synthase (FAD)
MVNKQESLEQINNEIKEFIGCEQGELFIEPKEQISDYQNIKAELLAPTPVKNKKTGKTQQYVDWINSAFCSGTLTWSAQPHNIVERAMKDYSFEKLEEQTFKILKNRMINAAFENICFVFKLTNVPRAITHQIVRHRQMAFGQQGYRATSCYSDAVRMPMSIYDLLLDKQRELLDDFTSTVKSCRATYKKLIEAGIPLEQARNIMPMGTCTKITVVMRLRDMIDYVKARTGDLIQDEHTYIVCLMMAELKKKFPDFYAVMKKFVPNISETMKKYL